MKLWARSVKAGGIGGDGLVAQDDLRDAAIERHGADGDDDGGQPEAGDEEAVEGAADAPTPMPTPISAAGPAPVCAAKPMASETSAMIAATDRSISRTRIRQRHAERDDRLLGEVLGHVGEVVEVEEIGRDGRVDDDHRAEQEDEDRLPARAGGRVQRLGARSRTW